MLWMAGEMTSKGIEPIETDPHWVVVDMTGTGSFERLEGHPMKKYIEGFGR